MRDCTHHILVAEVQRSDTLLLCEPHCYNLCNLRFVADRDQTLAFEDYTLHTISNV